MIPLLWGVAAAADDPTYDRLFGADAAVEAAPVEEGPAVPTWIWPASLLGVGLVAATRLRRSALDAKVGAMRVLDRQVLGDRSTLLVVEVLDSSGEKRRLLIGTGSGAPALVADLGAVGTPARTIAEPLPVDPEAVIEPELVLDPELEDPELDDEDPSPFAVNLAEEILAERGTFEEALEPELDEFVDEDDDEPLFKTPYIAPLPPEAPKKKAAPAAPAPSNKAAPRYFTDDDLAPVEDFPAGSPSMRVLRAESLGPQFASARR